MTDKDSLGFKAGLEIHQQLEGKKLFCECPTLNSDKKQDVTFTRKLRAVAGETGKIDVAAAHQTKQEKTFIYVGDSDDTCLIDYDEEPPRSMNSEALETAIKVALLLNAKIIDEIQVMRKTVVDGSNVSGFQRTALIAKDGFVETSKGKVGVPTICLEEEACQKLKAEKNTVTYKLDRLGIPLIEIATDASIQDPEHAKETAGVLGMILRSVPGAKRGLGTIRQDVNVSIAKGERTEIKGFQDLKSIPKVVEFEIKRQQEAISKGKKLEKEVRKAEPDFTTSFLRPLPGAARLYPETDVLPTRIDSKKLSELKSDLPKLLTVQLEDVVKKYKIQKDIAKEVLDNEHFEKLVKRFKKVEPAVIATALITTTKELKSRLKLDPSKLTYEDFEETISLLESGKINKSAILDVLSAKIKGEKIDLKSFESVSDEEIEKEVLKVIKEKPGLGPGGYMGLLMGKFKGKADGKKIMQLLNKNLK